MAQVISTLILIMVTFVVSDENIGVSVYDQFLYGNNGGGGGGGGGGLMK